MEKDSRRYDLDWLKVIAFILLLFFHTGMIFISWSWFFIQDTEKSFLFDEVTKFLSYWRMPLLFLISGAGTFFALKKRTGKSYLKERSKKLVLPFLFGILIIIPPQIYFEMLHQGWEFSGYLDFNLLYFKGGLYPLGDFSWHHLWFIAYLFIYSVFSLPVFLFSRSEMGFQLINKISAFLQRGINFYILVLPLAAAQIFLRDKFGGFHNVIDDGANVLFFFVFFVYGFLFCSHEELWDVIERLRKISLAFAIFSLSVLRIMEFVTANNSPYIPYWIFNTAVVWFFVIAVIGYARRYLNRRSKVLEYANEGIYPFYILHQTILIVLAYFVIQWDHPVSVKFTVLSVSTVLICGLIYDLMIRRSNVMRILFGMKPLKDGGRFYPVTLFQKWVRN